MATPTAEEIKESITDFLSRRGRMPTASEVNELHPDLSKQKSQGHITSYLKGIQRFLVLPNGSIRTTDGDIVWYRTSKGSMAVARHSFSDSLGHMIDG